MCQELELKEYHLAVEIGTGEPYSEDVLARVSDFNRALVDNPWTMKYDKDSKYGTFKYINYCMIEDSMFGIVLHYDSFHKAIEMFYCGHSLEFKK